MKYVSKFGLIVAAVMLPVLGSPSPASAAWKAARSITSIATFAIDGHVIIEFSGTNGDNLNSCGNGTAGSSSQFSLGLPTSPGQRNLVQDALAAFMSGRKVNISTTGTCQGNQEIISYLQVLPN